MNATIPDSFNNIIKVMTPSIFVWIPPAWVEYLAGHGGNGILAAQVHRNSYRRLSDGTIEPDVIARALVFMPADERQPDHLRRLTIRYSDTELNYEYLKLFPEMQNYVVSRVESYRRCAAYIKTLPMIDFHQLCRTWPVPQ